MGYKLFVINIIIINYKIYKLPILTKSFQNLIKDLI